MTKNEKVCGLNSNRLKIIAIISMTTDHLVSVLFPNLPTDWWIILLHIFGRIAAPTMWFFIVEGFYHTRNLKKYIFRMFCFAVISHFAYNFAFGISFIPFEKSILNQTSVIWPLAWGLVALAVDNSDKLKEVTKKLLIIAICVITFSSDWSCIAVLAILDIAKNRGDFKKQMISMVGWVFWYSLGYFLFADRVYGIIQMFVILAIPLLKQYNGERGNWKGMKWFFYLYYPLHLIICGIIRICLYGDVGVIVGGI